MNKNLFLSKSLWVLCCITLGLLMGSAAESHGGKIKNFSADQVFVDPGGKVQNRGNLYVSADKVRMESVVPGHEGNMVVIFRKDLKLQWMMNPKDKTYFEKAVNEEDMQKAFSKGTEKGKEEDLGTEKVSGYKCRKKRIEMTTEFMGYKRKSQSVVWISDQFEMPLRTQTEDGALVELRNIKKGKQSKDLFEIPAGYKKVAGLFQLYGPSSEAEEGRKSIPEEGKGYQLPKGLREKLPKGFKLPFSN